MSRSEQLSLTRKPRAPGHRREPFAALAVRETSRDAQAAARETLRNQVARLERELSELVASGFPDIAATPRSMSATCRPRLLSLADLERERDALVASLHAAEAATAARERRHQAGRELLAAMQLEPGRYKFVRLRAVDVGERGCGVWQVRPRLGVIGMLAGWWRVKLSSGCPLARGRVWQARPARNESPWWEKPSLRRRWARGPSMRAGVSPVPRRAC
jgi:hypothetical protein